MKKKTILIMVIIAAFAAFAVGAFKSSLTPYVTFGEAEARWQHSPGFWSSSR